ncbi:MAG: Response regulator of zinc sigma-54-dependent two-component system [Myxococcaceae bacterium]|nr:Response regulator of zinc sigma-54-dependent two-component system [Myxococcaceae bacterium]
MPEDRTRSIGDRGVHAADATTGLRLIAFCGGQVSSHKLPPHGEVVIGRGEDTQVRIDHATVSRRHATLLLGTEVRIVDHGSFNGTTIGGTKIAPNVPIPVGLSTIVELGETMIVVQVEGAAPITASRSLGNSAVRTDQSAGMQHLYRLVDNVAQSNITVIVRGETGSGKEVVSEEIHRRSARAAGPLVKLNCAALPEHLLEGELFGYERGAFTGADKAKAGLIESADGGTLFLDEIGEMPLATQAKLLRVVESREVMRLGSLRPKTVDVRFVAATHRDLEDMVARGQLRQDLYYRLAGVSLVVPPLRERVEEIPRIAEEFVARFCADARRPTIPISSAAMRILKEYAWPGNVRELRNVMERAVVFSKGAAIAPEQLGLPLDRLSRPPGRLSAPSNAPATAPVPQREPMPPAPSVEMPIVAPLGAPPTTSTLAFGSAASLPDEMEALERQRILDALAKCGGNQTQAAEMLGISRRTLLRRLDEYAVPRPRK